MILTEPIVVNKKTGTKIKSLPKLPVGPIKNILNYSTGPGIYNDPNRDPAYKVSQNIYNIRKREGTYVEPAHEILGMGENTVLKPGMTYVFPKKGGKKTRKIKSKSRKTKSKTKKF